MPVEYQYNPYLFIVVLLVAAAGFAAVPLALAWLWAKKFSPRKPGQEKNATYECGLEGDPAVEDTADRCPGEARLHGLGNVVRAQAVAGDGRSIQHEPDERHVHLLFERHVDGTGNADHDVAHALTKTT